MADFLWHLLLPQSIWGWLGYSSLIALGGAALFLSLTGGSKLVGDVADVAEAAVEPLAKEAGTLAAAGVDLGFSSFGRGVTAIAANPIVLWPMIVLTALGIVWGVRHYTVKDVAAVVVAKQQVKTATAAQKAAATRLAQCLAAVPTKTKKPSAPRAPSSSQIFDFTNLF